MQTETLIIGAGISGLSTAHFLSKKTSQFLLLESSSKLGGVIQSKSINDFICENGPNTVLLNNKATIELIKDLGLWDVLCYPKDESNKKRFVFDDGNLTKIPNSFLEFLSSGLISVKSKIFLLSEFFRGRHKENTTVYNFIKKRFGKEIHDKLFEPFLTGIYAGDTRKMSAKHSLKNLWNYDQKYGSIFKAIFSEKLKRSNSFNFPNGLRQMIDSLGQSLNKNILKGAEVTKVSKVSGGYEVLVNNSYTVKCKKIVSTVPSYVLKNIIDNKKLKDKLVDVNYNPIDVFHFGFRNENIKNKIQGFGVLTKKNDQKNYLGVLFNSSIFSHLSRDDMSLYTVLVGGERQKSLCNMEGKKLQEIILNDIEELINHEGEVVMSNHYRWVYGIPQYNLNQDDLVSSINNYMSENEGFYIIGSYFDSLSVSDCIQKGKKISEII